MLLSWDLLMTQFVPSGNCGTDVLTLTLNTVVYARAPGVCLLQRAPLWSHLFALFPASMLS